MGGTRSGAVGFSIGSKGYTGMGMDGSPIPIYKNDLWEWDQTTNTWAQMASFPGQGRILSSAFVIGNNAYVGLGKNPSFIFQDFWNWDQTTNSWVQIANFSGTMRCQAVSFSIGSKGYVGTGYDGSYKNDFWEYSSIVGKKNKQKQSVAMFIPTLLLKRQRLK